jgi:hypothetical protein
MSGGRDRPTLPTKTAKAWLRATWLRLVGSRAARSVGVGLVFLLGALPAALGRMRCPVAVFIGRPCPGCGMTRAVRLLLFGDVMGSLRMHALAVPSALSTLLVVLATIWATFRRGSPLDIWRLRGGAAVIALFLAVNGANLLLWAARWFGACGGPVPV